MVLHTYTLLQSTLLPSCPAHAAAAYEDGLLVYAQCGIDCGQSRTWVFPPACSTLATGIMPLGSEGGHTR